MQASSPLQVTVCVSITITRSVGDASFFFDFKGKALQSALETVLNMSSEVSSVELVISMLVEVNSVVDVSVVDVTLVVVSNTAVDIQVVDSGILVVNSSFCSFFRPLFLPKIIVNAIAMLIRTVKRTALEIKIFFLLRQNPFRSFYLRWFQFCDNWRCYKFFKTDEIVSRSVGDVKTIVVDIWHKAACEFYVTHSDKIMNFQERLTLVYNVD